MPLSFRRLLNYLPFSGGRNEQYVKSSWHKPTPFDQWCSQPPFRAMQTLKTDHFRRSLRRRRWARHAIRFAIGAVVLWLVVESIRALILL